VFSINTNPGAMQALQALAAVGSEMAEVQTRISTGRKINGPKDNPATWAIAQTMRGRVLAFDAVKESLQRGQSTIDVAMAAGDQVSDLLMQMKQKALAASDTSLDATSRAALNEEFKALRDQIARAVNNAAFNGVNLIKAGSAGIAPLGSDDGSSRMTVQAQNLSLGGPNLIFAVTASFTSAAAASAMVATLTTSLDRVATAMTRLGTGSKMLDNHLAFVGKTQDTLEAGIGNLVDADLAKESVRLQALQVKMQLAIRALQIASSAPSYFLQLFRPR
jgi:flagellin